MKNTTLVSELNIVEWINEKRKEDLYFEKGYCRKFNYRVVFYEFNKAENDSFVSVSNDLNFVGSFISRAITQGEFIAECEKFLKDKREKEAGENFRKRLIL